MCTERLATGLFVLADFLCDNDINRSHAKLLRKHTTIVFTLGTQNSETSGFKCASFVVQVHVVVSLRSDCLYIESCGIPIIPHPTKKHH